MKRKGDKGCGGFWTRLGACLFDWILVTGLVLVVYQIGILLNIYVPVELTVLLVFTAYTVIAHCWKGRTIGKWLCGLVVLGRDGKRVGVGRIILRESVAKWLSVIPFGLGYAWCGISRRKRALHDYVSGTIVQRSSSPLGRRGPMFVGLVVIGAGFLAIDLPGMISIGMDWRSIRSKNPAAFPYEQCDPGLLREVASLDDMQLNSFSEWVRDHAEDPVEYAVERARRHQVVVFGEFHEKKEILDFLNTAIPQLYHQAGVTRVGMETYLAEDNDCLKRLVTADTFDRDLALRIARHNSWGIWGFKEYWDVMETVWRLNQTIPDDQEKVLIVGLDRRMDLQSAGMTVGEGDNPSKNCPVWEKLRFIRLLRLLPKAVSRDICMARQLEREIINKGQRGVVLVGDAHAWTCPQITARRCVSRMGALLRKKHGEKVFFVRVHGSDVPASLVDPACRGSKPEISRVMEKIIKKSGRSSAGFDTVSSPFGYLRDSAAFLYHYEPRLGLQDSADGYLYLVPWRKYTKCSWQPDYLSPRMFVANKPFYQTFWKDSDIRLESAEQMNRLLIESLK